MDSARGVAFFSEQVEIVGGVPILNHHVCFHDYVERRCWPKS